MWYMKLSWTILMFVVLFAAVKGSCLEYGHSCWGAHGKRSAMKAAIKLDNTPAAQQLATAFPYADNFAELFKSNNDNRNEDTDVIDTSSTNSDNNLSNLPHSPESTEGQADAKLTQIWRQQLKAQQQQKRQEQQRLDDAAAVAAGNSWRTLNAGSGFFSDMAERRATLHKAALLLAEAEQRQQQRRRQNFDDLYELSK